MAKSENQLPTIVLGGLIALVINTIVQQIVALGVTDFLTKKSQEYQLTAAEGGNVPWWVENINNVYPVILSLGVVVFAVAFYFFVVKEDPIRFRKKTKTESAVANVKKAVKKTVKKAKK